MSAQPYVQTPSLAARAVSGAADVSQKAYGKTLEATGRHLVGPALRTAALPITAPLAAAGYVGGSLFKSIGGRVVRGLVGAGSRAPGTVALNLAGLGLMGRAALGLDSQVAKQFGAQQAEQAMNFVKRSSVNDIQQHMAIRRGLEKTAARHRVYSYQELLNRVRKASSSAYKRGIAKGEAAAKKVDPPPTSTKERTFSLFGREGKPGSPNYGQYMLAGIALGTAATAAGVAGQVAASGGGKAGEMVHRLGRDRHYNAMLKADPQLKQYPSQEIRRTFNVLHKASPYVAKEPLLAASAVRSIVDAPRPDVGSKTPNISLDAIQRIFNVEASRQSTRYPLFQETRDAGGIKTETPASMLG
jgi:hypothetical protein